MPSSSSCRRTLDLWEVEVDVIFFGAQSIPAIAILDVLRMFTRSIEAIFFSMFLG